MDKWTNSDKSTQIIKHLAKVHSVASQKAIQKQLKTEIEQNQLKNHHDLMPQSPYRQQGELLANAEQSLQQGEWSLAAIYDDFGHFKALANMAQTDIDEDYWRSIIENLDHADQQNAQLKNQDDINETKARIDKLRHVRRSRLQHQWRKLFDQQQDDWLEKEMKKLEQLLIVKLLKWLAMRQQVEETMIGLSIVCGDWFDYSQGVQSLVDMRDFLAYLATIMNDKGLKELCDVMGRISKVTKSNRRETIRETFITRHHVTDKNVPQEITGIHLGRNIEFALPQELALLGDEDISILFDLKYVEGRLMSFELEGVELRDNVIEKEMWVETDDQHELGPMIICLDTSGSMKGGPDVIAKAVTLYMAARALSQQRNCFLINFSSTKNITSLDLSGQNGISQLLGFLKHSYNGGTDVEPSIELGTQLMTGTAYGKADLLVVSDLIFRKITDDIVAKVDHAKANNNKFYSLCIGRTSKDLHLKSVFDNEWIFDLSTRTAHSVTNK